MDSAGSSLAVDRLYGGCHHQCRRHEPGATCRMDRLAGTVPAYPADGLGSLHVRAAVHGCGAQRTTRLGAHAMARKPAKVAKKAAAKRGSDKPVLLSGGNRQIAK